MSFSLELIIIFIASCILSPMILLGVSWILRTCSLLDRPHLYKSEAGRKPVPYGAGVSLILTLTAFVPILYGVLDFTQVLEHRLHIILALAGFIAVVSFLDDMETIGKSRFHIHPILRLGMQIIV